MNISRFCNAVGEVASARKMRCAIGRPCFPPCEAPEVARALLAHLPADRKSDEDVVLMGHGARHEACSLYIIIWQLSLPDWTNASIWEQ